MPASGNGKGAVFIRRLSKGTHLLIEDPHAEWRNLDERIAAFDAKFMAMARTDEAARRLATIPGIDVINATALVAAVGCNPETG